MQDIYEFAKKEELDLIHEYSMKILNETGVSFMGEEAVEIFKRHGFKVDGHTVFMNESDVMKALKTVPKQFDWHGRDSHVVMGGGITICAPAYGPMYILEDGEFHMPTRDDFIKFSKLNATSKTHQASNPNMMDLSFMPSEIASNWAMATTLMLNTKPAIGMVDGRKSAIDSINMAQEFYGLKDKNVVCSLISIASPLRYSVAMCEALIEYAKRGQSVMISPAGMGGLTLPDSMAGALLVNNTEILAGIVLAQLINPGTPTVYGNQTHGTDLRYTVPCEGSPEQSLFFHSAKAFGKYYGNIPVRTGGVLSDAKQVDMQAGVESFSTCYATLHSGADIMLHSGGGLDSNNTLSYDKYIYDEEVVMTVQRMLRGIEVNEETLQLARIQKVGPGGDFIGKTSKLYRNDYLALNIPNRTAHSIWINDGAETIVQRTKKAYQKRLAEYVIPELDAERKAILERYVPAKTLITQ